jgi:hypothetical protein
LRHSSETDELFCEQCHSQDVTWRLSFHYAKNGALIPFWLGLSTGGVANAFPP